MYYKPLAAASDKAHYVAGAVTLVVALENDLVLLHIRNIGKRLGENKDSFLFQLAHGFVGNFIHQILDGIKITFG